ncbi:MAG TPA: hypothetical protein VHD60_02345 [Candidatus Saccharimonadales bacterium]|nr:hypothetical protein [Candidatus Saccharimonadales bacterium]
MDSSKPNLQIILGEGAPSSPDRSREEIASVIALVALQTAGIDLASPNVSVADAKKAAEIAAQYAMGFKEWISDLTSTGEE